MKAFRSAIRQARWAESLRGKWRSYQSFSYASSQVLADPKKL